MKLSQVLEVQNKMGLHARPAAQIARLLYKKQSTVTFTYKMKTVDAKQVMNILLLEAQHLAKIEVFIEGEDAEEIFQELSFLFETRFGEI